MTEAAPGRDPRPGRRGNLMMPGPSSDSVPRRPATEPAAPAAVTPTAPSAGRQPEQPPLSSSGCRSLAQAPPAPGGPATVTPADSLRQAGSLALRCQRPLPRRPVAGHRSQPVAPWRGYRAAARATARAGPGSGPGGSVMVTTKPGRRLPVSPSAHADSESDRVGLALATGRPSAAATPR